MKKNIFLSLCALLLITSCNDQPLQPTSINETTQNQPTAKAPDAQASSGDISLLTVDSDNPRYFMNTSGEAVYLTGSNTWANRQERGIEGKTPDFDYEGYLDFMKRNNHNFMRLWVWEHAQFQQYTGPNVPVRYDPLPYARTGPGKALDGKPKFDLSKFNEEFFNRLRDRVRRAGQRGIYTAVMLFQGFSVEQKLGKGVDQSKGNPWDGHPFNPANNINNIDGDLNNNGEGEETHELANDKITALQEAYVRKVINTVGDLDNVLWEVSNESSPKSTKWQYHFINFIHNYEKTKSEQHPVGMTSQFGIPIPRPKKTNKVLFKSPADYITPGVGTHADFYLKNPPIADGKKVVIVDTDHIRPFGHNPKWAWKNFLRGNNFGTLDPYKDSTIGSPSQPDPDWDAIRRAMGQTLKFADRVNLGAMIPKKNTSSTKYALVNKGEEYLIYQPKKGPFRVHLSAGSYDFEWFNPQADNTAKTGTLTAKGGKQKFTPPFAGTAVLYLKATGNNGEGDNGDGSGDDGNNGGDDNNGGGSSDDGGGNDGGGSDNGGDSGNNASAANPIPNNSFEAGETGWYKWKKTNFDVTRNAGTASSGHGSARTSGNGNSFDYIRSNRFKVTGGTAYSAKISIRVQGRTTGYHRARIFWYDKKGKELDTDLIAREHRSNGVYKQYETSLTSPARATSAEIRLGNNNADGTAFFDDLSLTQRNAGNNGGDNNGGGNNGGGDNNGGGSSDDGGGNDGGGSDNGGDSGNNASAANPIPNNSFEAGETGWYKWKKTNFDVTRNAGTASSGHGSARTSGKGNSFDYIRSNRFKVTGGTAYSAKISIRVQGRTTGYHRARIFWYDDKGNKLGTDLIARALHSNGKYKHHRTRLTSPAQAARAEIRLGNNNADGTAFFDNLSLTPEE